MQSEGPREPLACRLGDSDPQDAAVRERAAGAALCDNQSKSGHHSHFTAEGTEARQACWGQEPYHQGEPCPQLNKAGWVLGAFIPQLDPGPECSLSWAVAR